MASWHPLTIPSSDFPGRWNWFELSKPGTKFVILHFLEREELRHCQSHPHFPHQSFFVYIKAPIFYEFLSGLEVVIPSLALRLEVVGSWSLKKNPRHQRVIFHWDLWKKWVLPNLHYSLPHFHALQTWSFPSFLTCFPMCRKFNESCFVCY